MTALEYSPATYQSELVGVREHDLGPGLKPSVLVPVSRGLKPAATPKGLKYRDSDFCEVRVTNLKWRSRFERK
jgi:hypothetical protein